MPGQDILGPLPEAAYRVLIDGTCHRKIGKTEPHRVKKGNGPIELVRIATEARVRKGKEARLIFSEVEKAMGVSQRVAIGKVHVSAWDTVTTQTKMVVLN